MWLTIQLKKLAVAAMLIAATPVMAADKGGTFTVGDNTFLLNGTPFVVKAAELHYPRIPRPYWEHRIKMCKALGMNTVCLYVFWNIHEQREGEFDFTGQNDVAEFCRLCQKNSMYAIVRPGPYVCAEWEMGGLPWWLLKKKDIRLREQDPYFMERVRVFEQKVAEQLAPLTIQRGGPIIMVQVENEYGAYGEDKAYVTAIRDIVRTAFSQGRSEEGRVKRYDYSQDKVTSPESNHTSALSTQTSDLVFFQCDWSSNFTKNGLDDLVWTMNFGTGANIDAQFKRLCELRPTAPKMCSEFWSGWFDKWGARHETRPAKDMVTGIGEMLRKGISFSLYMTHGGTSFGHWAGANSPGFAPDVTSYDYDAPVNEYGQATPKYRQLRDTLQKYADHRLPAVPKAPMPLISVPGFTLTRALTLNDLVTTRRESRDVLTMEDMDTGWGMMKYTTTLPEIADKSVLTLNDCHDYALVYLNGRYVGTIDRVRNERSLVLPPVKKGTALNILVEAMGRINFGRAIKDYKGITKSVTVQTEADGHELTWNLKDWTIEAIADDYAAIKKGMTHSHEDMKWRETIYSDGGYFRGEFTLKKVGDTFINMEAFGKGQVWINGHALGRYWRIGPQQTLYVPGCWLRKGTNEVVVLDIIGPKGKPVAFCQDHPELDKLNTEKPRTHNNTADRPDLGPKTPAHTGRFAASNGWQSVKFAAPATGRYIALDVRGVHGKGTVAAVAELYATGTDGKRLSREPWTVKYADSEDIAKGNNTADKVFDLQESTYWQTAKNAPLPHLLVIDLGSEQTVTGIDYLPRAEQGAPGCVSEYAVYVY